MSCTVLLERGSHVDKMLESYLGKPVKVGRKHSGAPYLEDDPHEISISHKDDYLAVAVSDGPVGVDLEWLDGRESYFRIARRYFGEQVQEGDVEGFFLGWTKREALGKYLGVGLNKEVMTSTLDAQSIQIEDKTIYFCHFIQDGYMVTVASQSEHAELIKGGNHG